MSARRTKRLATAISIGSALALPACFGTETGNPPFAPELGGGGYEPMVIAPDPVLEAARIAIEQASLEDCEGRRVPLFRAGVLDAMGGVLEVREPLEIVPGTFCALELRVAACEDADLCRALAPHAVAIDATRRADGAAIEIRGRDTLDVRLEGTFEVTPDEGGLLLAVDRAALTAGLSLTTLEAVDGVVRIDADHNADRLPALADGVRSAITLRRDLDDDGALDPEELDLPPLAAPRTEP